MITSNGCIGGDSDAPRILTRLSFDVIRRTSVLASDRNLGRQANGTGKDEDGPGSG
jgi:hypothetical protein